MAQSLVEAQALAALQAAHAQFSRKELAFELDASERQIERWLRDQKLPHPRRMLRAVERLLDEVEGQPQAESQFTFIDLFAGIGGTRLGFEQVGGQCVFTCEFDKYCQQTYKRNFRPTHTIAGDIKTIVEPASEVPDHDVLVAGFPCQPFSISGVSKRNALGRAHGFECDTEGTLFFDICRILAAKRPLAFMLENVKNLRNHDGRRTFAIIEKSLQELGYTVTDRIIDASKWVPQHRERVFIVGFREPVNFSWEDVKLPPARQPVMADVLHGSKAKEVSDPRYTYLSRGGKLRALPKYTLTKHLWQYLQAYREKHEAAGNGFGFGTVSARNRKKVARTLSARYFKDGSEILVVQPGKNPRRLTPRECARLMGFPETFEIPVSDTQAYKQFGNSVVVPVVGAVAEAMKPHVLTLKNGAGIPQIAMAV
jgi:DNA (cytosine-5)-methyltransferase 1